MAKRILRDWTCSENIDKLSPQAEVFFTRLIMKADDFGCFHGNPKLLKAALYPLKEPKDSEILKWINECSSAGVIIDYEVDGKQYVKINDFGQRLRAMNRKFPDPLTNVSSPLSSDSNPPLEEKRREVETEDEVEVETEIQAAPFDFKKSLLSLGIESSILSQWMKVRKNKKAVNTEIAFKGIEREIRASGRSPNECIVIAVERSWSGFKAEWLNSNQTNNNGSQFTTTTGQSNFKGPTMGQRLDEAKRRAKERRMQQGSGGTSDASDEFASYTDA